MSDAVHLPNCTPAGNKKIIICLHSALSLLQRAQVVTDPSQLPLVFWILFYFQFSFVGCKRMNIHLSESTDLFYFVVSAQWSEYYQQLQVVTDPFLSLSLSLSLTRSLASLSCFDSLLLSVLFHLKCIVPFRLYVTTTTILWSALSLLLLLLLQQQHRRHNNGHTELCTRTESSSNEIRVPK